ncbi:uncharacterized protein [Acropora muricata]|uniref:uncharacterized protein isoform X1 n=1 Tax=Acropora muricata TaxID=159855 RepID=UPI0034E61334
MDREERNFKAGGKNYRLWVDRPQRSATSQTDGPAGCAERTTSTTEGHIGEGETSQTRTPPSSNNTSEERQVDKSAENAFTGTATVQVKEDLGDLKDLSVNDFDSSLALDKLNVTLVTNHDGWKITVTDQLLTELAKDPLLRLSGVATKKNPELLAWAEKLNIELSFPGPMDGFNENEILSFLPDELDIDVLIIHSYGIDLGKQAQVIKKNKKCKWVHVVHTISEELAKFGKEDIGAQDLQIKLCESADMIIAIGPKVAEAYRSSLRSNGKYVFDLTPGVSHDLIDVRPVVEHGVIFRIMVSATYYEKYFEAKGLDIAAKAINWLKDTSYRIFFLVTPDEEPKELESRLKGLLNQKQFTVKQFQKNAENWKTLLCQVQLAILPSRAEGFGTTILSALSADVPVLIGGNTGLGMAVKELSGGPEYIIDSDEPEVWAKKIKEVREKGAGRCSEDAKKLRKEYMKNYGKTKQCHTLVEKMLGMFPDRQGRLRNSAEHVEDVNTMNASYSEFGFQEREVFSALEQGNKTGAMAQPVQKIGVKKTTTV